MHRLSILLLAVVVLVPLLILPGVFFHFDVTPKAVVLLAGAAASLMFHDFRAESHATRWIRLVLMAQAASLVISTLHSTDPAISLTGSNWRRFGLLVQLALLIYTYLLSRSSIPLVHLLRAILLSGSLAALYAIAQYSGWDPWMPKEAYYIGEGVWTIVRPPGTLGHAGYLAVYLIHSAFAGLALLEMEKARAWRSSAAAGATLATAAILLSGTRAAILGLMAGAALLVLRRRPRLTPRRIAVAGAVVAAAVLFYFSPAGLLLRSRTRWYREDPAGGGRLTLWADTLRMSSARWLVGYGPETYSSQYAHFESESLARRFPDRYWESPHNIFLDALAGQGILGLLGLMSLAALGLWTLRRSEILFAGLAASLVANQFLSFTIPTALLFYVTVATGTLACRSLEYHKPSSWLTIPVAAILAAAAFSLGWSDYWLARTRTSLDAANIEQALHEYQLLRRFSLPGLDTDLWYSRAIVATATKIPISRTAWSEAFGAAQRASKSSEQRPNAFYNVAAFYAMQNDFAGTEQSLRAAIACAPLWYKPHWMLARVLQQAGRLTEAEAEASRAAELNAGKDSEVSQTWQTLRRQKETP